MTINQPIVVVAQYSTDGKGFKVVGNSHAPWPSVSDFLSSNPATRRHNGMFGYIENGGTIEIWHFVGGITDDKFVKFGVDAVTAVLQFNSLPDFPAIGSDTIVYIAKDTWTSYVWDGADYHVFGNPGPAGPKGDKGNKGDTGDQGIQGIQGEDGADGAPTVTLRNNGINNLVQSVLDMIDSDTVAVEYVTGGKIKLNTLPKTLFNGKAGTSEAIAAGVIVGASSYTNLKLAGKESETFRSGYLISDFDQGGDVDYAIKDTDLTLDSDTITFLTPIYDGEWIKIKIG